MLMETRLICTLNSADFSSPSQVQSVFKKYMYSRHPGQVCSVIFFPIAFVQFIFADISGFFSLDDMPQKVNE